MIARGAGPQVPRFDIDQAAEATSYGLQPAWGSVWAATLVALLDFLIARVLFLLGRSARPGPEIELALDLRRMAVESVQADAEELRISVDTLEQKIQQTRDTIVGFIHHPLDAATEKLLLIPAALSIIRGLRAMKDAP